LKVVHVLSKLASDGQEIADEFEEIGEHKVILVDRKVDTYYSLLDQVLKLFFGEEEKDI
jgi:hypothetical protein